MRRLSVALAALIAIGLGAGCATASSSRTAVVLPEMRVVGTPVGPDALEVYDARTLFMRGLDLLQGDQYRDAASYFERLVREFPSDEHVLLAHYNAGVCHLKQEHGEEALAAFDRYLALLPAGASQKDRLDGLFKRGAALATLKRYEEVAAFFDELLGEELAPDDRVEALVDAGVGHFMRGDRLTSEARFLEARRIHKSASERARLDMGYFLAQAGFYLGELARLEFSEFKLRYPSADEVRKSRAASMESLLGDQLEEKCQLLLRAQYAYLRAIRDGHPGWASAAGYKVGEMYEELHDELVTLPAPPDLSPSARELYAQLVRKKVLILLEKAVKTWESTSDLVTRTGADSEWATRTRKSLERVRQQLLSETQAAAQVDDASHDKS